MRLNTVVMVPEEIARKAIGLSQGLKRFDSIFTLDGVDYTPHVSLYMTEFDSENIPSVETKLRDFTKELRRFELHSEKFFMNDTNYIDIQYAKDDSLKALHEKTIHKLMDLRKILHYDRSDFVGPNAEVMYENSVKYGYGIAMEIYRPHLTLTKMPEPNTAALDSLQWDDFDFTATKLGLFEADELGACRRLIKSFDFSH